MDASMMNFACPEPQDGLDEYDQKLWQQAEDDGFFDRDYEDDE
jgi:hypothetical protein